MWTGVPLGAQAMTSPPPSETGASAEALAEARKLSEERCPHLKIGAIHGRGLQYVRATHCDECVALALDRAKRSAHLEDARAGCQLCARPEAYAMPDRVGAEWLHKISD